MRLGIIGAGHIGGNLARRGALAGYDVAVSFARDQGKLAALAEEIGGSAVMPDEAAKADLVVLSTPWDVIDEALVLAGPLDGKIVIDTTNYFGGSLGVTQARYNADRMPGAAYTKCFNTLTAGFQAAAATRTGADRAVQWIAGDDTAATDVVAGLVRDAGYVPVVLSGIDGCAAMESPRRPGAVYGEEYREDDALDVVASLRALLDIPSTPAYT
jgi:predicted dinucleotide-binding enzyme